MRRSKVSNALVWLKAHNRYYEDIIIDEEILQSLPENGSIADFLLQQTTDEIPTDEENGKNGIARSFVPLLTSTHREDTAINDTLNRMQTNNSTRVPIVFDIYRTERSVISYGR